MSSPTHVELFGLPASGKTAITSRLATGYLSSGYQLRNAYKISVCRRFLSHPHCRSSKYLPTELFEFLNSLSGGYVREQTLNYESFLQYVEQIADRYTKDKDRKQRLMGWLQTLVSQFSTALQELYDTEVLLCDEGFLQRAVAVFCPPNPLLNPITADVEEYLTMMPLPDRVILLDVPIAVTEQRMLSRRRGPPEGLARLEPRERRERLTTMQSLIDRVETNLIEKDVSVLRVENQGSIDEACEYIIKGARL